MSNYFPHFVTETDEQYWTDCTWAALTMGIDKWTYGQVRCNREALRLASGDRVAGSTYEDLRAGVLGYSKTKGWHLPVQNATWADVQHYLSLNYGIVVMGYYSKLLANGGHFARWDTNFAHKAYTGHAAYIQRTGPLRTARAGYVWWMDPLGRGTGFRGEWMPLSVLKSFMSGFLDGTTYRVSALKEGAKYVAPKPVAPKPVISTENVVYNVIVTPYPFGAVFHVKAGTTLVGYSIDLTTGKETAARRSVTFSKDSAAACNAKVVITAPTGFVRGTFARASSGGYAGMLLHWPDITVTENPDPAIAAAVKAAVDPLNAQIASLNAQIATLTANANSANAALSAARLSLSKWDAFKKLLSELVGNIPQ